MERPHFSVAQICEWTGGRVVNEEQLGAALARIQVSEPQALGQSTERGVAYFFAKRYQSELPSARPGVLITGEPFVAPLKAAGLPLWKSSAVVACADPYLALAVVSGKLAAHLSTVVHTPAEMAAEAAESFGAPKIHPTAVVDPTAELGAGVQIGAHAVISGQVRLGAGTVVYPGVFVGPGAELGERCVLFPNVTIYEQVRIGNDVRIHASAVIGADGFGYALRTKKSPDGKLVPEGHQKIYHLGRVVIGDNVEIGALTSIDRGTIEDTRVEREAKIDNHVHLGHNTHVDEGAIICGAVAVAGNASVGKWSTVGGLSGIINNVHVGTGAKVGAMALVSKDVVPQETVVGNPQREYSEHFRLHAMLNKMIKDRRKGGGASS